MATGRVFSDEQRYVPGSTPNIAQLFDVLPSDAFGGIRGRHFRSANACRAYTCTRGDNCTLDDAPQVFNYAYLIFSRYT